jgi:hypothetical protein
MQQLSKPSLSLCRLTAFLLLIALLPSGCDTPTQAPVRKSSTPVYRGPQFDKIGDLLNLTDAQKPAYKTVTDDWAQQVINMRQRSDLSAQQRVSMSQEIRAAGLGKLETILTPQQLELFLSYTSPSRAHAKRGASSSQTPPQGSAAYVVVNPDGTTRWVAPSRVPAQGAFPNPVSTTAPAPSFEGMPFEQLLASQDPGAPTAKARNHALLSFKALNLPNLLREKKTTDLTALTVQIEQTILDLNREAELAKDHAQQAVQAGSGNADPLRELSLLYKERIEILKPILTAIKEEIANRNK